MTSQNFQGGPSSPGRQPRAAFLPRALGFNAMSKIRILTGPLRGREKSLNDKSVTIGRDVEAGIQILDRSASRFHCEVFPVGGMWFVRDLESKNGTHVNDERLQDEELLRIGDVIRIGTTEMVFEPGQAIADDDSSNRVAYNDDPDMLSNTLEFKVDALSDLSDPQEVESKSDNSKGLRILYQVGRILSDGTGPEVEARVLDCLIASMPAECALIFRREPTSGKLVPAVVRTSAPHIQPIISRSIIKKTFTENKALHSANAQEDDRFSKNHSVTLKGIRSVVCVPLTVGGRVVGVLYLSRGASSTTGPFSVPSFDQFDLELASAVAIQVGLAQAAGDERRRHQSSMQQVLTTMVRALESRAGCQGSGERCARASAALATALGLDAVAQARVRQAGLLHHFTRLITDGGRVTARNLLLLEHIDDLETILPLVRQAHERLDGSGPGGIKSDDLDTEVRILAAAVALEDRLVQEPTADPGPLITILQADRGLDQAITAKLMACHLDGTLYQ